MVPAPFLVSAAVPLPLRIPEYVVEAPLPPVVSAPPLPSMTGPAPSREPMVILFALMSSVAPVATDTADELPIFPEPIFRVPPETLVGPLILLLPLVRTSLPVPLLSRPAVPLIREAIDRSALGLSCA